MQTVTDDNRFPQLLTALKTGWEIEEPVLIRAAWRSNNQATGTYHFVLRKKSEDKTVLLSLSPSTQLLTFLAANNIKVSKF